MSRPILAAAVRWAAQLAADVQRPWPYERCSVCQAPLRDLTHSVEHMQGHFPYLWPALREAGKKPDN